MSIYAIFGASGGIGSYLASSLSKKGHTVYLLGRHEEKLIPLAQQLSQPFKIVDPHSDEAVANVLKQILSEQGSLAGVASCIGSFFIKPLHMTSVSEFKEVLQTNLISSFTILKSACHLLSEQKKGSIVLCSSTAALAGLSNHEAISAAKGAIASMVRSAAASYASKGVRVNAVAPGLTRTPLAHSITSSEISLKASTAFHPIGRIGEASDVANAIEWLLNENSSWITGDVIAVDGGLSSLRTKMSPS
ncbi:MAG: SDR family oxidoreductase [Chlamydiae bacterium]|nr:SDR family oxidoreductase [Chlamydiota bacterium]